MHPVLYYWNLHYNTTFVSLIIVFIINSLEQQWVIVMLLPIQIYLWQNKYEEEKKIIMKFFKGFLDDFLFIFIHIHPIHITAYKTR